MKLSIGKRRGIARCSSSNQIFTILALDHRNNLYEAFNKIKPVSSTYVSLVDFKMQIIDALAPSCTAVLLDPEIGVSPAIESNVLPGETGLLVALEATGYTGDPSARVSRILDNWSVGKTRKIGADCVKLLIYYHPDSPLAKQQEDLISKVAEDCALFDIPLFLEPLSYSLDPNIKKLPSEEKRYVVIETASKLTRLGVDILKAEFPLNVDDEKREEVWRNSCDDLSNASRVPWVLLSAGVDFDTFLTQAKVACQSGASGVLAGRAIWKEAISLEGDDRVTFLKDIALNRMQQTKDICEKYAKPWTDFYPPASGQADWYVGYSDVE